MFVCYLNVFYNLLKSGYLVILYRFQLWFTKLSYLFGQVQDRLAR
jgi:hypothetical protein